MQLRQLEMLERAVGDEDIDEVIGKMGAHWGNLRMVPNAARQKRCADTLAHGCGILQALNALEDIGAFCRRRIFRDGTARIVREMLDHAGKLTAGQCRRHIETIASGLAVRPKHKWHGWIPARANLNGPPSFDVDAGGAKFAQ